MTRTEIISQFRDENPEITPNVASTTVLNAWLLTGDKEICAITRCIVSDITFDSVVSTSVYLTRYDLTAQISEFYDVDEYPGGGVSFDDDPLDKTTIAELDADNRSWRTRSAGTPKEWYRRGKYLYFDRPVKTAGLEIRVYCVLISDDFNNDNISPFNQQLHLEPFHNSLVVYLKMRAKAKVGKREDASAARQEYLDYTTWMKKMITGGKVGVIKFQPKANYVKTH